MYNIDVIKPLSPEAASKVRNLKNEIVTILKTQAAIGSGDTGKEAALSDVLKYVDQFVADVPEPSDSTKPTKPQPTGEAVRCRDNLRSPREQSDFITCFGLDAFENLPQHAPATFKPEEMTAGDLKTMSPSAKAKLIAEIGSDKFAAIVARKNKE